MDLCPTNALGEHRLIQVLGPEPLGNEFGEDYLVERLKHRNTPIKSMLLDQRVVAGLGNIYVCEALFRAGISPTRKASRVAERRVQDLVPVIRDVLRDAIEAGGSSLRDYRRTDGELGYFQHSFRVYGREGAACVTENCQDIVRRIVQSGRSSFYCPSCQR
jgi:formamidopyrimidine-DNA glycosylase